MREGEVKKVPTKAAARHQYVNLVTQSFEHSRDTFGPFFQKASRWYKLYRGYQQGKFVPGRANITVPLAFSLAQADAAKKGVLLLGQNPYLKFIGMGPEDARLARKQEALINAQLYEADSFDKGTQALIAGAIYGTFIYETFWDIQQGTVEFRADLGGGEQFFSSEEFTFDGPNWAPVSIFDFFPAPGFARIRDMPWVVKRQMLEREDINRLIEEGFFDAEAGRELGISGWAPINDVTSTQDDPASGGMENSGGRRKDFDRPVEVLWYWGRAPRSMNVEGSTNLCIAVANRSVLLKARPNHRGKIPFGAVSQMPDPRYFHGPSKIETIEKLQIATNAFASQKADVLNLFADPQFFYNKRGVVDPRKLTTRPGKWHGFDGEVDSKQISAVFPDLRALNTLYTELEQHSKWMQQGTGIIDDTVMGFNAPDRETARSFVGRQEGASTRLLMEAKILEALWLEPLAMDFVELNRKYLTVPRTLQLIGSAGLLDPWTLQPVPPMLETLYVNDLLPDYSVRAVGATRQASQQGVLQQLVAIGQIAMTNPIAASVHNWYVWFRELYFLAGVPNPDELLNSDPVIQQAMAAAQGGGTGGAPVSPTPQMPMLPGGVPMPGQMPGQMGGSSGSQMAVA